MRGALDTVLNPQTPKQQEKEDVAATPDMLSIINDAQIAKTNGDIVGLNAASRNMVNELRTQDHKHKQDIFKATDQAKRKLDESYQLFYNMLSTPQIERKWESLINSGGDIEEIQRLEGILQTRKDTKYAIFGGRGGIGGAMKRIVEKLTPEQAAQDAQSFQQGVEAERRIRQDSPFGSGAILGDPSLGFQPTQPDDPAAQWKGRQVRSFGKGAKEMVDFLAMLASSVPDPQNPEKMTSGLLALIKGEQPPKAMQDAQEIANWYWQQYGEDAANIPEYQIAVAWRDKIASKWESPIIQMFRKEMLDPETGRYASFENFAKTLNEDSFKVVADIAAFGAPILRATGVPRLGRLANMLETIDAENAIFTLQQVGRQLRAYRAELMHNFLLDESGFLDISNIEELGDLIAARLAVYGDVTGLNQIRQLPLEGQEVYVFQANRTEHDAFPYGVAFRNPYNQNIEMVFGFADVQQMNEWASANMQRRADQQMQESDVPVNVFNEVANQVARHPDHVGVASVRPVEIEGLIGHDVYQIETFQYEEGVGNQFGVVWFNRATGQMGGQMTSSTDQINRIISGAGQGQGGSQGRPLTERLNSEITVVDVVDEMFQEFGDELDAISEPIGVSEVMDLLDSSDNPMFREIVDGEHYALLNDLDSEINQRLNLYEPDDILDADNIDSWAQSVISRMTDDQMENGIDANELLDILEQMGYEQLSDSDMNLLTSTVNETAAGMLPDYSPSVIAQRILDELYPSAAQQSVIRAAQGDYTHLSTLMEEIGQNPDHFTHNELETIIETLSEQLIDDWVETVWESIDEQLLPAGLTGSQVQNLLNDWGNEPPMSTSLANEVAVRVNQRYLETNALNWQTNAMSPVQIYNETNQAWMGTVYSIGQVAQLFREGYFPMINVDNLSIASNNNLNVDARIPMRQWAESLGWDGTTTYASWENPQNLVDLNIENVEAHDQMVSQIENYDPIYGFPDGQLNEYWTNQPNQQQPPTNFLSEAIQELLTLPPHRIGAAAHDMNVLRNELEEIGIDLALVSEEDLTAIMDELYEDTVVEMVEEGLLPPSYLRENNEQQPPTPENPDPETIDELEWLMRISIGAATEADRPISAQTTPDPAELATQFRQMTGRYNRVVVDTQNRVDMGAFPDRFNGDNPNPHSRYSDLDADMVQLYMDYARLLGISDMQVARFLENPELTHPRLLGEIVNLKDRYEVERFRSQGGRSEDDHADETTEDTSDLNPSGSGGYNLSQPQQFGISYPPSEVAQAIYADIGQYLPNNATADQLRQMVRGAVESFAGDADAATTIQFNPSDLTDAGWNAINEEVARLHQQQTGQTIDMGAGGGFTPSLSETLAPLPDNPTDRTAQLTFEINHVIGQDLPPFGAQSVSGVELSNLSSEFGDVYIFEADNGTWGIYMRDLENNEMSTSGGYSTRQGLMDAIEEGEFGHIAPTSTGGAAPHQNLEGQDVSGQDFSGQNLNNTQLRQVNAQGANFSNIVIDNHAGDNGFFRAMLDNANFDGANISNSSFNQSSLQGATFRDADVSYLNFYDVNATNAIFDNGNLTYTSFNGATLTNTSFRDANLTNTDFRDADITTADFTGSNWRDAYLRQDQREFLESRYGDSGEGGGGQGAGTTTYAQHVDNIRDYILASGAFSAVPVNINAISSNPTNSVYSVSLTNGETVRASVDHESGDVTILETQTLQQQGNVDMPVEVRSHVYDHFNIPVNSIASGRPIEMSTPLWQGYEFTLADGQTGRVIYHPQRSQFEVQMQGEYHTPFTGLTNFTHLGHIMAMQSDSNLTISRVGEYGQQQGSAALIEWTELAQLDPRLTPDNISAVSLSSQIQGQRLLEDLRDWKLEPTPELEQSIKETLDRFEQDNEFPDTPEPMGGGGGEGGSSSTPPLNPSVVSQETPDSIAQMLADRYPQILNQLTDLNEITRLIEQDFGGQIPPSISWSHISAIANAVADMRQGSTLTPTPEASAPSTYQAIENAIGQTVSGASSVQNVQLFPSTVNGYDMFTYQSSTGAGLAIRNQQTDQWAVGHNINNPVELAQDTQSISELLFINGVMNPHPQLSQVGDLPDMPAPSNILTNFDPAEMQPSPPRGSRGSAYWNIRLQEPYDFEAIPDNPNDYRYTDLRNAQAVNQDLTGLNLEGSDMSGADLRGTDFRNTNLTSINFTGADLRAANLRGVDIEYSNFTDAMIDEFTILSDAQRRYIEQNPDAEQWGNTGNPDETYDSLLNMDPDDFETLNESGGSYQFDDDEGYVDQDVFDEVARNQENVRRAQSSTQRVRRNREMQTSQQDWREVEQQRQASLREKGVSPQDRKLYQEGLGGQGNRGLSDNFYLNSDIKPTKATSELFEKKTINMAIKMIEYSRQRKEQGYDIPPRSDREYRIEAKGISPQGGTVEHMGYFILYRHGNQLRFERIGEQYR